MSERVVVDPITRIEGHLRVEAQMDGDVIAEAWSSGTMVRGIEIILRDRDPRDAWAFAQRICGVCTLVHGIARVMRGRSRNEYAAFVHWCTALLR
jgi:hydrogenase large subunit